MDKISVVLLIVFILAAAAAVILLIPVRAYISFKNEIDIYVKIGFIKKHIELGEKEVGEELSHQAESEHPKTKLSYYADFFRMIKKDIYDLLDYMCSHGVIVEKLDFYLKFGWRDEPSVGIAYGMANAVIYTVMGVIHNALTVKKRNIEIVPEYDKEIFETSFDCILKTRIAHISVMAAKSAKLIMKVKKANK